MSSYVYTSCTMTGPVKDRESIVALMKGEKEAIDFNSIVPEPPEMIEADVNSLDFDGLFLLSDETCDIDTQLEIGKAFSTMGVSFTVDQIMDTVKRYEKNPSGRKRALSSAQKCLDLYHRYGVMRECNWKYMNWGATSNAIDTYASTDAFEMTTMNYYPDQIITAIANKFPEVTLDVKYADGDDSSFASHIIYKGDGIEVKHDLPETIYTELWGKEECEEDEVE